MQARLDAPVTSSTLAICGWTARTPSLLQALEARGFAPVAIADRSAAAVVAAAATLRGQGEGPARYQHPREMLRRPGGATVLLDMPEAAAEAAAAQRGASVLVAGDAIGPETLEMLARTRAVTAIVRPLWWRASVAAFIEVARPAGQLSSVTLAAGEDRPARAIAEDLVSVTARLIGGRIESVACTAYAPPHREVDSVVTSLRFAGNTTTALLIARRVRGTHVRAELSSSTTHVRAAGDGARGNLTMTVAGDSSTTALDEQDHIALAIDHALAELASGGMDPERLFEEAALLRRFRNSLDGLGSAETDGVRWETLAGGGHLSSPRRGHLHLVTA